MSRLRSSPIPELAGRGRLTFPNVMHTWRGGGRRAWELDTLNLSSALKCSGSHTKIVPGISASPRTRHECLEAIPGRTPAPAEGGPPSSNPGRQPHRSRRPVPRPRARHVAPADDQHSRQDRRHDDLVSRAGYAGSHIYFGGALMTHHTQPKLTLNQACSSQPRASSSPTSRHTTT